MTPPFDDDDPDPDRIWKAITAYLEAPAAERAALERAVLRACHWEVLPPVLVLKRTAEVYAPRLPINEEELQLHAEHMMQAPDLSGYSYNEVCRILTVANYVGDLCVKEIGDRGQLTWSPSPTGKLAPIIPDNRPPSMFVSNVLTDPDWRPPRKRP
jgi:hypothetical protein